MSTRFYQTMDNKTEGANADEIDTDFAIWYHNVHYNYPSAPRDALYAAWKAGKNHSVDHVPVRRFPGTTFFEN